MTPKTIFEVFSCLNFVYHFVVVKIMVYKNAFGLSLERVMHNRRDKGQLVM